MKFTLPKFAPASKAFSALTPEAFANLSERDRRLALIGAVALVALLLFGLIVPLDRSVTRERVKLAQKRADLAWMQSVAPEIARTAPPPSATGESLLVIIDRSARESGLGNALAGSEPGGGGQPLHSS